MPIGKLRKLKPQMKALTSFAVLLDGREAVEYLANDLNLGNMLSEAAEELASLPIELRLSLIGTELRSSLLELEKKVD
ncbi:MAG: hypothetical protein KDD56_04710 [Bdellovibrionales bacterium]|nr:hypothetical protein [Bdellovibrionales bacterium]